MTTTTLDRPTTPAKTIINVRTIIVTAANRHGGFMVRLDDGRTFPTSRQPLLSTARRLLAEGENPEARIEMRRADNPAVVAASCDIGSASKWTVKETGELGPVFARYQPPSRLRSSDDDE